MVREHLKTLDSSPLFFPFSLPQQTNITKTDYYYYWVFNYLIPGIQIQDYFKDQKNTGLLKHSSEFRCLHPRFKKLTLQKHFWMIWWEGIQHLRLNNLSCNYKKWKKSLRNEPSRIPSSLLELCFGASNKLWTRLLCAQGCCALWLAAWIKVFRYMRARCYLIWSMNPVCLSESVNIFLWKHTLRKSQNIRGK